MRISGGLGATRWHITTHDHTNHAGTTLRRELRLTINPAPMTGRQAHTLATALHHAAKNGAKH